MAARTQPRILNIVSSVRRYEAFLKARLKDDFIARDIKKKHADMKSSALKFLRATCWRWAELIPVLCPELAAAPKVLSTGDCHIENFGLWRDLEGRLVWGLNDFDEAAEIAYPFDVVRLATSAALAEMAGLERGRAIAKAILDGYRE